MKKLFLLIPVIFIACSSGDKNCSLKGQWSSVSFIADKAVDINGDGVFNVELTEEKECAQTTFYFKSNGKVERSSKNPHRDCRTEKNTMDYKVEGNQLIFSVSGMVQKHQFQIIDCQLFIYGIRDSGKTENGRERLNVTAILEK